MVLEERSRGWARLAHLVDKVVDLPGGAVEALKGVVVPVLRNMAGNADSVVPEGAVGAHALGSGGVVDHIKRAGLA